MRNRTDVLVMIWGMSGRDPQALIPTIFLLREKYGLKVTVRSMFDYACIDRLKPRVLLTNGCNGSLESFRITKYATSRGIYTVSLHAEGAFRKENLATSIIGRNLDAAPTVRKWFLWNENAYTWTHERYPQFRNVIDISGSPLHEKYSIFNKGDFDKHRYTKGTYSKLCSYIGWGFDHAEKRFTTGNLNHDPTPEREYCTRLMTSVAKQNSDVMFILKNHPGALDHTKTEISDRFANIHNVTVINDEITIFELIFVSDLIINYDSTTVLDAWIAGTPTITLYRGNTPMYYNNGFGYSDLREASIVPSDEASFLRYFDEFNRTGTLHVSHEMNVRRALCIRNYLGNPARKPSEIIADHIVQSLIKPPPPQRSIDLRLFSKGLVNRFFYHARVLPAPKQYSKMRLHYRPDDFEKEYLIFLPKLVRYFDLTGR